jgi:hypothetical protein
MIHHQVPLGHEFLHIPQAERESHVQAHTVHDHGRFELSLAEQWRPAGDYGVTLSDRSCNTLEKTPAAAASPSL